MLLHAGARAGASLCIFLLLAGAAGAGEPPLLPWEGERDPRVPSPGEFLGHPLGARLVTPETADAYLGRLAETCSRVQVFTFARSHEGRPLRYAVISSEKNIERLDALRRQSLRMADPGVLEPEEAAKLVEWMPVFAWFAGAVHGDEVSSTEAILAAAWQLASGTDRRTKAILDNVVVLLTPVQNPDGRARFIQSHALAAGPAPSEDPAAAEHNQPWPSGRFNHALFDLNRDWIWLTQPETRGKVAAFLAWRPQLFGDLHEMSTQATYYFAPPDRPLHPAVPASVREWFGKIGQANAAAFDRLGFDYFTRERYDLFYPGYGDSWPSLHGAVGMTYEQAGPAGRAVRRRDGTLVTLHQAISHHATALLTTLEISASERRAILADYLDTLKSAPASRAKGEGSLLVPPRDGAGAPLRVASLLAAQGIRVRMADAEFRARADAPGFDPETRLFPAGTLIIPSAQPARPLVRALFDPDPEIDEAVLEEAERMRKMKARLPFFDVTSWSLPHAALLPAFHAAEPVPRGLDLIFAQRVERLPGHLQPPGGFDPWPPPLPAVPLGEEAARIASGAVPGEAHAWLLRPSGPAAAAALVALLKQGRWEVEVAGRAFTSGEKEFPAGTAILKRHRNPPELHGALEDVARRYQVRLQAAGGGLTEKGPDLGSSTVRRVSLPRIAVLFGEPARATGVGSASYVLRDLLGLDVVQIRAEELVRPEVLRRFDAVVLPDGPAEAYRRIFKETGLRRFHSWMDAGGTLVTFRGASALAAHPDVGWTTSRVEGRETDAAGGADVQPGPPAGNAAGVKPSPPEPVPGAVLRVIMDTGHPLGFGYPREVPVPVRSNLVFSPSDKGIHAATFADANRLRMGGFVWPESLERLEGRPYALVEKIGSGRLVLFAGDPTFRGAWEGLARMVLNAVVLVRLYPDWPRWQR